MPSSLWYALGTFWSVLLVSPHSETQRYVSQQLGRPTIGTLNSKLERILVVPQEGIMLHCFACLLELGQADM